MHYIGIDLGTTGVRLLMADGAGRVVNTVSREYPLYLDDRGWSEQNPADWLEQTVLGLAELTGGAGNVDIKAVSFSGQMHGLVILDENDEVIRPAILWNDQRTQAQCDYLNNEVGRHTLIDKTANVALTGFTAPKILWVKENEPENFKRIRRIMLPKDYLAYKLSGVHATDYSDASGTLLLDVKNRRWSGFMLDLIGITEGQLPGLYDSFDAVGNVLPEMAQKTGLKASTKVVIGGGDQAVGAVGSGAVINDTCSISLGTSGVVFVASDSFNADYGPGAIHSFCHANSKYHMMGVTLAAAASNKWWVEDILSLDDYEKAQNGITELGTNRTFFLPYLNGERTPHNDPLARGAFVGMSLTTKRSQMTQAVMEGVAFSLRDILEIVRSLGVGVKSARIIGGGAKSGLWCRMMANIANLRVEKISSAEGPALGASILASVGGGEYPSVEEACANCIKVTETFEPEPELVKLYDKSYEIFAGLYKDLKGTFRKMGVY